MAPYRFLISVVPTNENPHYESVGGAYANFIVFDGDQDAALLRAMSYLSVTHWAVQSVELACPFPLERLADFCDSELLLFDRAQHQGFAVDFEAWAR